MPLNAAIAALVKGHPLASVRGGRWRKVKKRTLRPAATKR
jgi:hypothetical protein